MSKKEKEVIEEKRRHKHAAKIKFFFLLKRSFIFIQHQNRIF